MIQILTYTGKETEYQNIKVKVNSLHDAESLDFFEINIIVLQDNDIWVYSGNSNETIDKKADFSSLSKMIDNSCKAQNIILLPQNEVFKYYYIPSSRGYRNFGYQNQCELKNMIPKLNGILKNLYKPLERIDIVYENTKTLLGNQEIPAAFYFGGMQSEELTKSVKSEKGTTIKEGNLIISTLLLDDWKTIEAFLKTLGLIKQEQRRPEWMEEINMFDDDKQIEIIRDNQTKIQIAETNIEEARKVINKNNKYKSILYTNGEELVKVVLEILEEMLGCDFSDFKDVKREDFLTAVDEYTFIGEIKGVNHNVKSENVAQLERHYQSFLDDNPDADETKICALLIMDHQKNKPIQEREPVHEKQVALARKYGSLIIDTYTLLKLFEKYLSGEKSRAECIDILQNNTGLLRI